MTDLDRKCQELFVAAIDLPQSARALFLDQNCDSVELRERLQTLLDAHVRSDDFMAGTAMEDYPSLELPFGGQIEEFKIKHLIGKGGMGRVYLAEDLILKRSVALKVVSHSGALNVSTDEILERFRREARAAARLVHPSVVQVYRTGEQDGLSYIAMEYVPGTDLRRKLKIEASQASPAEASRFKDIAILMSQVADAIEHAHRAGVIHRDIKPSNILIDVSGNARLADFGVARITNEDTLQETGVLVGSCAYMSPEQAQVLNANVDHRSDIFSLGVVLYEAICLQRPFAGASFNELMKALSDCNPPPLRKIVPKIPNDLSVICHKAIEKNMLDRYQSAAHFYADLRCFVEGKPILARPPSYRRRIKAWAKKNQRLAVSGLVVGLAIAVIGLSFLYFASKRAQKGRLEVSKKHKGSIVSVSRFSPELKLESKVLIGRAPSSSYLKPGLYRVFIEDQGVILEATSLISAGELDFIEVNSPSESLMANLVEVPGGTYELGDPESTYLLSARRTRSIASFCIASSEVSNREYREYVIATSAAAPTTWPTPYEPTIDDLPVTGITWDEANSYCRWRGVRLPTPNEWEVASKGPGGAKYPWGANRKLEIQREDSEKFDFSTYMKFARPVNSDPQLATPLGVRHMLSNVGEFTEGIAVDRNSSPVLKGRSWADSPFVEPSDIFTFSGRKLRFLDRGFRIAVSGCTER